MICAQHKLKDETAVVPVGCSLEPMGEYSVGASDKKRFGRYHKTNFWDIAGYGSKRWVVAVRISLQNEDLFYEMTDGQLLVGCLKYLNTPPPRKKYAKKTPEPKYGILSPYRGKRKVRASKMYLSALVIVGKRKNKFFWGKGKYV